MQAAASMPIIPMPSSYRMLVRGQRLDVSTLQQMAQNAQPGDLIPVLVDEAGENWDPTLEKLEDGAMMDMEGRHRAFRLSWLYRNVRLREAGCLLLPSEPYHQMISAYFWALPADERALLGERVVPVMEWFMAEQLPGRTIRVDVRIAFIKAGPEQETMQLPPPPPPPPPPAQQAAGALASGPKRRLQPPADPRKRHKPPASWALPRQQQQQRQQQQPAAAPPPVAPAVPVLAVQQQQQQQPAAPPPPVAAPVLAPPQLLPVPAPGAQQPEHGDGEDEVLEVVAPVLGGPQQAAAAGLAAPAGAAAPAAPAVVKTTLADCQDVAVATLVSADNPASQHTAFKELRLVERLRGGEMGELQTVVDSWPNYSPKQQSILCFVAEQIVSTGDWQCLSAALRDALLLIQSV